MTDATDPRNISCGRTIPTETYSDQPYVVRTDDGAWLCVVTTGCGAEGQHGQHVIALRSADQGRTWSAPVPVEPAEGPEASYAVLLKAPGGRIFCFYNHNTDNVREVIADAQAFKDGRCRRVDSLGHFVFKFSDDGGRTWSARCEIPQRMMDIDRRNPYAGALKFFWNVGRAFIRPGAACVTLHKVGGFGSGFFTRSEGVLLRSADLLSARDPAHAAWETLPDGDFGLRTPTGGGPVAEEQNCCVLSDGSIYCVYRTVDGHPAHAVSRDGGRTWSEPAYLRYADGRPMKHPRAACFVWKCLNGKYLCWFHNHGGRDFADRNPVWLCGGVEDETPAGRTILWSQPEIVLYDDDPYVRMSYPDLVEEGGAYFLTETQKNIARVHEVEPALVEGLWGQFGAAAVSSDGLLLARSDKAGLRGDAPMPLLPRFTADDHHRAAYGTKHTRQGFSVEVAFRLNTLVCGGLMDTRTAVGEGLCLQLTERGTVEIVLNDGRAENRWECDPGLLKSGALHHVVATVDGGPCLFTFVIDGRLCDGGAARQFGWGRFSPNLVHANGCGRARFADGLAGQLRLLRLYGRALRTSEAIANYRLSGGGS